MYIISSFREIISRIICIFVYVLILCDCVDQCDREQRMGTTEATLRMENMEVKDEWQDDDFPR